MNINKTQGLTCPNCRGDVPVPEGVRLVECPYCRVRSLVQGERGIRRWQVSARVNREGATKAVTGFYSGLNKAINLSKKAKIQELFLVYLPYWRVTAFVAGWMFGREKAGDKKTKPVEVEIMKEMHWNDAAVDVSEFGVHQVTLSTEDLEPYDADSLHQQGMVFEPTESRSEALVEAEQHFTHQARQSKTISTTFFEKYHLLRPLLSLVYYPLWVARYEYNQRNYQVVVDGVHGEVLYGKAPGNIFYRATALIVGIALGNLICVNGTLLAATVISQLDSDNEGVLAFLVMPIVLGLAMAWGGYRAFRYGEEIETLQESAKKAILARLRPEDVEPVDRLEVDKHIHVLEDEKTT